MKKLNKIISAILAGIMVFGLVACSNPADSNTTTESATKEVENKETSTAADVMGNETTEAPTEAEDKGVTYPLDTDYTITYWGMYPLAFSDVTKPYTAGLIEKTGINLNPTIIEAGDSSAYQLLLTEKVLPNLIQRPFTGAELAELYEDGAIWDLSPYLEEYAPDYWAFLNAEGNEDFLRLAKDEEGRILYIGSYLESEMNSTYIGPVVRKDWLEECNLPMPVTLEDWEKTLVAFKEKYGATLSFAMTRWKAGISSGTGAMSAGSSIQSGDLYVDSNGKVQYSSLQPEFKEMLEVLARWNEMGLIDQDSFTQKDKDVRQKVMDGKVGLTFTALSQLTNWISDAQAEGGSGAEWVGLSYPRTEAGAPTTAIQVSSLAGSHKTVVTTSVSEEDLKVVLAWVNYGFTEEGFIYQNFGEEGVAHTVDAEGNVVGFTDAVKGSSLAEFADDYLGTGSSAICGIQAAKLQEFKNAPASVEALKVWTENSEALDHLMPSLVITDESYTDKYNAARQYIKETVMKFILGEEDLANFDAFVQSALERGMKDCLEIQQKAYDAYLAR